MKPMTHLNKFLQLTSDGSTITRLQYIACQEVQSGKTIVLLKVIFDKIGKKVSELLIICNRVLRYSLNEMVYT